MPLEPFRPLPPHRVGRRSLLRGAGLGALALGAPSLLASCGTESQVQTTESCTSTDLSDTEKMLVFSNWPEYIDVKGKKMPTLEEFQTTSGISVTYNTDINDNNEFFGKVKDQLGSCEPIGRDIVTMTDWMAARMISLGWMQELDKDAMPNVAANLKSDLRSPTWDPDRSYSVPWQSGLTGIAYNAKYTGEVGSFEELMTRSDLKGKVSLLSEMGDTMLFMLLLEGADPEEFSQDQWGSALERLEGYVKSGQVRRFNPSHQWIKNKIDAGELKIQQMDVQTYFFRRTNTNAKGEARSWTDHLLWHHACHTVDLFQYQTGESVSESFGLQGPKHPDLDIAMDMAIGMKTPSGAICTLSLSFNNDGPLGTFFRYICDNGTYIARYDDLFDGNENPIDLSDVAVSSNGIELIDREFISAIEEGREPNGSVHDVLAAMKTLDRIEQSF